jgi:hypothetical protein
MHRCFAAFTAFKNAASIFSINKISLKAFSFSLQIDIGAQE